MNLKQKATLLVWAAAVVTAFLYPPFHSNDRIVYAWIWNFGAAIVTMDNAGTVITIFPIDVPLLFAEWFAVSAVAAASYLIGGSKSQPRV